MWKKAILIVSLALNILLVSYQFFVGNDEKSPEQQALSTPQTKGYIPADGFVPDSLTAVRIAQAVWLPIYGDDILAQKPYTAKLAGDTFWMVSGTRPNAPKGWKGGVAHATIRKSDGKILHIIHGK